jgi:probable rRNA maturation factor
VVNIFFEDTEVLDLDPDFFHLWLSKVCESEQKALGEVSLVFCSDVYLLEMNKTHLDHDFYTDIITFDYYEVKITGDLFISIDRVKDNAVGLNIDFTHELHRVVVHGVLHLLGYGDKSEKEEVLMREMEDKSLLLIVPRET